MCKVSVIRDNGDFEGIKLRRGLDGPELSMVKSFSESLVLRYESMGGTSRILLLYEPMLDSGYPDIVAIRYTESYMKHWRDSRLQLTKDDLKVLSRLLCVASSDEELAQSLGFSLWDVSRSTGRLSECGVIRKRGIRWRPIQKNSIVGIKSIESFEAKMQSVSDAHRQAIINTRFSCASYVVVASKRPSKRTRMLFERSGVGLLADGGNTKVVAPQKRTLPNSHVVLQFNEWLARHIVKGGTY